PPPRPTVQAGSDCTGRPDAPEHPSATAAAGSTEVPRVVARPCHVPVLDRCAPRRWHHSYVPSNSTRLPPAAPMTARFRRLRTEGRRPTPVHRTATPPAAHARPPRATDSCSRAPPVATVGRTHSRQYPNE